MPRRVRTEITPLVPIPIASMTTAQMRKFLPHLRDDETPNIRRSLKHKSQGLSWRNDHEIGKRVRSARRSGKKLNEGVVAALMGRVTWPKQRPFLNERGIQKTQNGFAYIYLDPPGCRVEFETQEKLAEEIGCSKAHLKAQIKIMKELEIILLTGHGWIEFDAVLVWRGTLALRDAYIDYQQNTIVNHMEVIQR